VVVDAIIAKRNLGTQLDDAPFVIGLGPGFTAGLDVHVVIGTNRGHNLGRIYSCGSEEFNTGVPGNIAGYTFERVVRTTRGGVFATALDIGAFVRRGDSVGTIDGTPLLAGVDGVVRGLLRSGMEVEAGFKIADIDPRREAVYCHTISDKARAIAGSVLEAVLRHYQR
jgi:xanthine dehydrogenase accessory factor